MVGGGIIGLLVAHLAARLPGTEVTLVDVQAERRTAAEALGVRFALPADAPKEVDCVFHTSALRGRVLIWRCPVPGSRRRSSK